MDESLVPVPSDSKSFLELLTLRGLAHDPQRVLAAVYRCALVGIELYLNSGKWVWKVRLELGVASLAYANGWGRVFLDDPQASVRHDASLAHLAGRA
jgi:hypothetical protein